MPDHEFESQFSFMNLIRKPQKNYNLLTNAVRNEVNNTSTVFESPYKKENFRNDQQIITEEKYNVFNNMNNYLNDDNELNVQRISTLNINLNEKNENSNLKESDDTEIKQHKFKNMEIDLNTILDIEKQNLTTEQLKSDINKVGEEEEFKLNNDNIHLIAINNKKETIKEEYSNSFKSNLNFDSKTLESNEYFKTYKENIMQNIITLQSKIQLIDHMITYKDKNQLEIINKITPNDTEKFNEYQNKLESDLFNFSKGFIFQNYINSGILLDPINNFPKKGYSILFSFKWEPLSEIAVENRCDLFYLLETKVNRDEKENKDNSDNNNNNFNKMNHNGSDFMNNDEFYKTLKLGCYIQNRKIFIHDASKSFNTNIEVIPGVSYVILIDQKESYGFVRKVSKVIFNY